MPDTGTVHSIRSRRGTQREYETVLVLRPQTGKAAIADLITRARGLLEKNGSRLQALDNWGLRTLAYPIRGCKQGSYLYLRYLGGSDMVKELERNFRIYEEVIRYLSVKVDEDVDPGARPSEITDEAVEAASDTSPDPVEQERVRVEAERKAAEEERKAAEAVARAESEARAKARAEAEAQEARAAEDASPEAAAPEAAKPEKGDPDKSGQGE